MSRSGIQIEGDIYLEIDTLGMTLKKYTGTFDKKGNENYVPISYPSSLTQVAKKLYQLRLNESTAKDLKELIADHKRIIDEINETFSLKGLIK